MVVGFEHTLNQNKFDSILKLENMFPVVFFPYSMVVKWKHGQFTIVWAGCHCRVRFRTDYTKDWDGDDNENNNKKYDSHDHRLSQKNAQLMKSVCNIHYRLLCVFFFISYAILNLQRKPQLPNWRRNLIITRIQGGV